MLHSVELFPAVPAQRQVFEQTPCETHLPNPKRNSPPPPSCQDDMPLAHVVMPPIFPALAPSAARGQRTVPAPLRLHSIVHSPPAANKVARPPGRSAKKRSLSAG